MRLVSWNVNGLRAVLQKGFLDFLADARPDVVCLQEIRARPDQLDLALPGYTLLWHPAERPGYAGTAVFTRPAPRSVSRGLGPRMPDPEGRVLTVEYDAFHLVNVYTPNAQRGLTRLAYRLRWEAALRRYLRTLEQRKPVVFGGDLNVAHREIDLARPAANVGNPGFTPQERAAFDRLLRDGYLDTFRVFTPDGGHYTWWAQFANARARNIGWRIDYFCISAVLRPQLMAAGIRADVYGSDHCPVTLELDA